MEDKEEIELETLLYMIAMESLLTGRTTRELCNDIYDELQEINTKVKDCLANTKCSEIAKKLYINPLSKILNGIMKEVERCFKNIGGNDE